MIQLHEKNIEDLVEKQESLENDAEIYRYALTIIISTLISIGIIISMGICLRMFISSIVYIGVLMTVRTKAGGYHASSYVGCNCLGGMIYLIIVIILKIIKYYDMTCRKLVYLLPIIITMIGYFAPVVYRKKIKNITRKKAKVQVVVRSAIWSGIAIKSYEFNTEICNTVVLSLVVILIFMLVERIRNMEKEKIGEHMKKILQKVAEEGGGSPSLFIFYEPTVPRAVEALLEEKSNDVECNSK